jgi:putative acetyltransferase
MNAETLIRDETEADAAVIGEVTEAAFRDLAVSDHTEHLIVAALRAAEALSVSLVAERDGEVVGHIAFSPVTISGGATGWYGLGPVSVLPRLQRQGIGAALIEAGLARLRASGAAGCCLVGHPVYYPRFGFRNPPELGVEGVPGEVFFALSFTGDVPRGRVTFHEAFGAGH